jgi:acyl-coenzyme A thioesterase PaaI-like protein
VLPLTTLGTSPLEAVTTSLDVNFLKRPQPGRLFTDARLLSVGPRLVVGEFTIMDPIRADLLAP